MNKELYFTRRDAELELIGQILMASVIAGEFTTEGVGLISEEIQKEAETAWKLYNWCFTYGGGPMGEFDPLHPDRTLTGLGYSEFIGTARLLFKEETEEFSEVVPDVVGVNDDLCGVLALIVHANHYSDYKTEAK